MYNSQETALRIKTIAKSKSISIAELQAKCGLGKNAINQLADSQEGMKSKNIYMIADYLGVSIDYLLGHTDSPNTTNNGTSINQQYIGGDANASITNENDSDKENQEILEMIKKLSIVEKSEIILKINEMINKK